MLHITSDGKNINLSGHLTQVSFPSRAYHAFIDCFLLLSTMSNFKCKDFEDIGRCFEQLNSSFRIEINSLRSELKGVKEKITAIEGHVEYIQSEFQTLHNETIPAFEDKLMKETNQRLALELWGRK
jgi:hypothetical protein